MTMKASNEFRKAVEIVEKMKDSLGGKSAAATITPAYRELNRSLHQTNALFGSKGYQKIRDILEHLISPESPKSLLDYGTGKGSLLRWASIYVPKVRGYDPAVREYERHPKEDGEGPFDVLVCSDVLEHIEPNFLEDVLDDIRSLFTKAAFVCVSTGPSNKTLADGRNAHLIQQSFAWWTKRLEDRGLFVSKIVEDIPTEFAVVVKKDRE